MFDTLIVRRSCTLLTAVLLTACGTDPKDLDSHPGASGPTGATPETLYASIAGYLTTPPTAESASKLGPYQVQSYSKGIPEPWSANYADPTIYYPVGGVTPYPGVVFIPGNGDVWWEDPDTLPQWGALLASHGFVVMFVNPDNLVAMPKVRATVFMEALNVLAEENARSRSPLLGKLDTQRLAVMGHSFGGSGALYAADTSTDPRLKAVVGLNPVPHLDDPTYSAIRVPALLIAGEADPFIGSTQPQYDSIPVTTPKLLVDFSRTPDVIVGSMHFVAHSPLGKHIYDPIVARITLSFLKVYLMNDTRYQQFLVKEPSMRVFAYNH